MEKIELYEDFFDSVSDVILFVDAKGNIIDINKSGSDLIGYGKVELRGMNLYNDLLVSEDVPKMEQVIEALMAGVRQSYTIRWHTRGGGVVSFDGASTGKFDEQGRFLSTRCILREGYLDQVAQTKLEKSQVLLKKAQEIGKIGHWELNFETDNLVYSEQIHEMFSTESAQFKANYTHFLEITHPSDRDMVNDAYVAFLQNKMPYNIDHRILFENGELKWVNERAEIIYDENESPVSAMGIVQDITAQKKIEEQLVESEKKFRTIVTNSTPIVSMFDKEGIIILSEGKMLAAVGVEAGEVVGRNVFELYKDFPEVVAVLKMALRGEIFEGILPFSNLFFEVFYSPNINSKGEIIGVIGMALDITERKQAEKLLLLSQEKLRESEEKFRSISEQASEAITIADLEGNYVFVNHAFVEMIGYSEEELLTMTVFDMKRVPSETNVFSAAKNGAVVAEIDLKRKDGTIFLSKISGKPIHVGQEEFVFGIVTDITEQKNTLEKIKSNEKKFVNLYEQLKEINQVVTVIDDFSSHKIGENYFKSIVLGLSHTLKADYTFIASISKDLKISTTEYLSAKGEIIDNIAYALQGTPCAGVVDGQVCYHSKGIQALFPNDLMLVEMEVEAYVGVPVYTRNGADKEGSILVALFTKPIDNKDFYEHILGVFAQKIQSEMERNTLLQIVKESELKYKDLFDNISDGMCILNKRGDVLHHNPAFSKILGYDDADWASIRIYEIIHPDYRDVSKAQYLKLKTEGVYNDYETKVMRKDKATVWVQVNSTAIFDHNGKFIGSNDVIRNITERKKAELEIQKKIDRDKKYRDVVLNLSLDEDFMYGNIGEAFPKITKCLSDLLNVNRVSVWLFSERKDSLDCMDLYESSTDKHSKGTRLFTSDYPLYFKAIIDNGFIYADNALTNESTQEFVAEYFPDLGVLSMLDVGVTVRGELLGVVCIEHTEEERIWSADEITISNMLASLIENVIISNEYISLNKEYLIQNKVLGKAQEMLEQTSQVAQIGGWEVDFEEQKVIWSEVTREIHEVPMDYVPNLEDAINFYIKGESRDTIKFVVNQAIEEGISYDVESKLTTAKNREIWVRGKGQPEFVDGKCIRLYGTFQDITQQKELEQELEKANEAEFAKLYRQQKNYSDQIESKSEELNRFFELSSDMICIVNTEGVLQRLNPALVNSLGYTEEEMLHQPMHKFLNPDDKDETIAAITEAQENDGRITVVNRYQTKDGDFRWFSWHAIEDPSSGLRYAVARDITEEKKANKEIEDLKNTLDQIAMIIIIDNKRNIVSVNNKFCDASGYSRQDVIGEPYNVLRSNYHSKEYWLKLRHTVSIGKIWRGEMKTEKKDGSFFWADTYIVPFYDEMGKIVQYIAIQSDITARKKLEKDLREAEGVALKSAEIKENFLANMSHEIRTPMNAILGFSRLLLLTKMEKNQYEYAQAIYGSAENLLVIINDILDFSKIESGKFRVENITYDLTKTINDVLSVLKTPIKDKNLELILNISSEIPPYLIGAPNRVAQVLINLIGNAVKFTPKGYIKLTVTKKDNDWLLFEVKDTGIGIPREKLESIFESFTQAENNTTRMYGGTGLGLSISKKIVSLMGGSICVVSEVNMGSTFSIQLPFKVADVSNQNQEASTLQQQITEISIAGANVLVVEDNKLNQELMVIYLKMLECNCDLAVNGQEAIDLALKNNYDLIFMDIQMPIMDGLEATKLIREQLQETPIVAMTAHALEKEKQKCFDIGMNDYLGKPFRKEELEQMIVKHISQYVQLIERPSSNDLKKKTPSHEIELSVKQLSYEVGGDQEMVKQVLLLFKEEVNDFNEIMQKALAKEDLKTMAQVAHKVKPNFQLLGLNHLVEIILELEKLVAEDREEQRVYEYCHELLKFIPMVQLQIAEQLI